MRITVNTQDLNAAISTVTKALSSRTTVSILEGIYMEAIGAEVLVKCTDMSLQIETVIPAEVMEDGAAVMPGRLFSEMARRLPAEDTELIKESDTVDIQSGKVKTSMQSDNPREYPTMPSVNREFSVTLSKNALKSMIKQCVFASAQDETKPILTGVLLEIEPGSINMVALDGYRLAMRKEHIMDETEPQKVIIPARSLLEISRILEDSDDDITVIFSKTHVLLDMGDTRITTRLLEGEFIRYKQILPKENETRVRINRTELLDAIERASLMAREGKSNLVKFAFANNILMLSANSDIGNTNEEIICSIIGNELDIAFNARYFTDVLKTLDDTEIYLDLNTNVSPCVVKPVDSDKFYYLILPVRMFSGV